MTAAREAAHTKGGTPVRAHQGANMLTAITKEPKVNDASRLFHTVSKIRRASIWLDAEVKRAQRGVTAQQVDLTPELADALLDRNPSNRKLKQTFVDRYTRDMLAGSWQFNGEAVIVSGDGALNDGQHRCAAVIKSGVTIPVILIVGVARETRTTLDQGATRIIGDYLAMEGFHYSKETGAAASYALQWGRAGLLASGPNSRPTKSEILNFVRATPSLVRSVEKFGSVKCNAIGGPSLLAFCYYACWSVSDKNAADEFFDPFVSGEGLKAGSPILYVRNRIMNERRTLRLNDRAELIFRAWNAFQRGQTRTLFRVVGGELPMLERAGF